MSQPTDDDVFLPSGFVDREAFSPAAGAALDRAVEAARQTRWETVRSPHVFMGLVAVPDETIGHWGFQLGVDLARVWGQFRRTFLLREAPVPLVRLHREFWSRTAIEVLRLARNRCAKQGHHLISPADLLTSLLVRDGCVTAAFAPSGLAVPVMLAVLAEAEARFDVVPGASHSS